MSDKKNPSSHDLNSNPARDTAGTLEGHQKALSGQPMLDLFRDEHRLDHLSLSAGDLYVDFSKNRMNGETLDLLFGLAGQVDLAKGIGCMFDGEAINSTEGRAVGHVALRQPKGSIYSIAGRNVSPDVHEVLDRMEAFAESIRTGERTGAAGQKITDVVNIGIGGSDLGPRMVCEALRPFADGPRAHFVSNVDGADLLGVLDQVRPETTLFLVASKTFTTQETMTNARTARDWLTGSLGEAAVEKHFAAMSTNAEAVSAFGIDTANMFPFWDWVGGRFSLWSAIGLPIAIAVGMARFRELLAGAHLQDENLQKASPRDSLAIRMALVGYWNSRFDGCEALAVLPYDHSLARFPAFLQQLDMESNGKGIKLDGTAVEGSTGPILFGEPGTNGQHSFYQLIHQSPRRIACDFLAAAKGQREAGDHHVKLLANFLAQPEALMRGKDAATVRSELTEKGLEAEEIETLLPHKVFPGNRPSTTILFPELTPSVLGQLIALYEHKVFVQGLLFGINSFDQWGVELGKQLAGTILAELKDEVSLKGEGPLGDHDASTLDLIRRVKALRS
ncbi:MAG: glucose-6-phosphate isomerase [Magnetovibrionaceae bacterium]